MLSNIFYQSLIQTPRTELKNLETSFCIPWSLCCRICLLLYYRVFLATSCLLLSLYYSTCVLYHLYRIIFTLQSEASSLYYTSDFLGKHQWPLLKSCVTSYYGGKINRNISCKVRLDQRLLASKFLQHPTQSVWCWHFTELNHLRE